MAATAITPPIPHDAKPELASVLRDIHAIWEHHLATPYPYGELLNQDETLQRAPFYVYDRSQAVPFPNGGGHYYPAIPKIRKLLIIDYADLHRRILQYTDPEDAQHARVTLAFTERLQAALSQMNREFPFILRYYTLAASTTPFINPLPNEVDQLRSLASEARDAILPLKRYASSQPQEEPMWFVYNNLSSIATQPTDIIYHCMLLMEYLQNVQTAHYTVLKQLSP